MGKVKATSQQKKVPAIKSTQSIIKKRKKGKGKKKGSLKNIHKSNLNKSSGSNEVAKDIFASIQNSKKTKKHNLKNEHATKDMERPHVSRKYSKDNDKTTKIFQKVQINTDNKVKHKKKNNRVKQNINQTNNIKKVNASIKLAIKKDKNTLKKPGIPAKKSIDSEHIERKIKNVKKINKKKLKQLSTKPEVQQVESDKILKFNNHRIKIKRLEQLLNNKSQTKQTAKPLTLREKMMVRLRASRFRFINETLYNNDSSQSNRYFKEEPDAFKAYHDGYKQQLEQWPVNPLDVIISSIKKMPTDNVIADFGCGEAQLASSVPQKVHSFDFIALNDNVKACDMAHTPLLANSIHVVVFCLSLMGTNLNDYIMEANRVLKNNGILKIAEVESRFEDVKNFIKLLGNFGFKNTWTDLSHDLFYFMDFKKEADISMKRNNLPAITLKPCLYKKR